MKRISWLFLVVLVVLLVNFGIANAAAAEQVPTVYLDAVSGADTNDGLSEAAAVKTIEKAYGVLAEQNPATQGRIVLVTDYTFTFGSGVINQKIASAAHTYEVIITGKTVDVGFYVAASKAAQSWLGLQGPTTFENITMKIADTSAYTNILICGNGGLFKIGENVTTGTNNLLRLMAGPAGAYTGNMTIEIHSGNWQDLCAGAYAYTMNGNASLAMYGGSVVNLETTYNGKHNGDVSISIYGGTVTNLYGGSRHKSGVITGDITVSHYGGTVTIKSLNGLGTLNGTATVVTPESKQINLQYDDRKDLAELVGYSAVNVTISNEQVDSYKVGTQTKDDHVIVFEDGKLIATGIGTADLTVGSTTHKVTVTSATITMFMITGHSVGAGDGGSISQSVLCEAGQVYSTHRPYALTSDEGGLGYGAGADRVAQKDSSGNTVDISSQQHIDAFTAQGVGTMGEGSALGYRWNQLTGEKVWVLNLAVGGSCLNEWQTGVEGHATWTKYHYDTAVKTFGYAQSIVKNEIAAGHYTFGHMVAFYHNGVNYSNYPGWTYESIESDYEAMWKGYKQAFTTDMDDDGEEETLEGLGLVPFYNFLNEYDDHFDKPAGYYMASSAQYPDVFMASNIYFNWMRQEGLSSFPTPNYSTQGGTALKAPESVAHEANGGTSTNSVFCKADNMHPTQVVHNATGMQIAESLYAYLHGSREVQSLTFQDQAHNAVTALNMVVGEQKVLVPVMTPNVKGNVTYEATGAVSLQYPLQVVANSSGTGTVIAKAGDTILATVTVIVAENTHIHCVCGDNGAKYHSCEDVTWIAWGDDAYEQGVLPFLSGNYYLTADISVAKSLSVEPGETIRICLNGHTINTNTERGANNKGNLVITDCREEQGSITSAYNSKYAQICYNYKGAVLDIYGGNLNPQGTAAWGGAILNHGTTNVYGGVINGGKNAKVDTVDARGGALYLLEGQINLYGGTIQDGSATYGGNIYMSNGKLVIDGATITGGYGTLGGNIYADYSSVIEIKSGLIENGSTKNQGGNLYLYTNPKDTVIRNGQLTMTGGTIQNGMAEDRGSNIFATTATTGGTWAIAVSGGELLGGTDNVILRNNAQLTLSGGTVTSRGKSIQLERSSATAPTPVLALNGSYILDKVHMEADKGMIRLLSENVSPVTVTGYPAFEFYGVEGTHTVSANLTNLSLNTAVRGFGYKAGFQADKIAQGLLVSQGYSLWITEDRVIKRTADRFEEQLSLRLKNFDIENYGSEKVNAKVFMQLNNGITVESDVQSYSMQDMVEMMDKELTCFTDEQIAAVKTMLEGLTAPASWNIPNLNAN